jgi:L-amino acid N-acyltransferase YncA
MKIIDVNINNVDETGFFCQMSKKNSPGYQNKLSWLKERFKEGMKIKIAGRGFIEYIPGEFTWRSIEAKHYMVVHCLWVVGKEKGKGLGTLLLNECIKEAEKKGMHGVAALTSDKIMLSDTKFFMKNGFELIEKASPVFDLVVKKFKNVSNPKFTGNWDKKLNKYGSGINVIYSSQCPYIYDAMQIINEVAKKKKIDVKTFELKDSKQVKEESPSAFGVFNIVYNGSLLSYHCLTSKQLLKALGA